MKPFSASLLHRFPDPLADADLPCHFPSPFSAEVHPAARQASTQLREYLTHHRFNARGFHAPGNGKMFGVCVVRLADRSIAYLAAFSGTLAGEWQQPGFVGPVFDTNRYLALLRHGDHEIKQQSQLVQTLLKDAAYQQLLTSLSELKLAAQLELSKLRSLNKENKSARAEQRALCPGSAKLAELDRLSQRERSEYRQLKLQWRDRIEALDQQRLQYEQRIQIAKQLHADVSRRLQQKLFDEYIVCAADGSRCALTACFGSQVPPSGAGDCAAVKLLHHANENGYQALCLAEFWWGAPPTGGLRKHGQFYPSLSGQVWSLAAADASGNESCAGAT